MTKRKSPAQISSALRSEFYESVAEVLRTARRTAYRAVNFTMVEAYWNVGRMIVEEEQHGKERAGYGEALIHSLSGKLTTDFGRGFNVSNVFAFRQFYLAFSKFRAVRGISGTDEKGSGNPLSILRALRRELTWTHYRLLIRVENPQTREWYMKEAATRTGVPARWNGRSTLFTMNGCS
jgi:DUF1016 N-terminal domain